MTDLDVGDVEDVFPKKLQRKRFLSALEDRVMQEFHKQEMRELREQHKEDLRHQDQDEDGSKASASSPDPDSEFSYPDSEFSYPDVGDKPRSSPPPPNIIPPPPAKARPSHRRKMTVDIEPPSESIVHMEDQLAIARAVRNQALYQEHAVSVSNQRKAKRRFSILNVLDPSAHTAAEEGRHTVTVLPPSTWSNMDEIVRIQQMRHDHLRPVTGSPALVGAFDGAAAFVQHAHQGYANVAGQARKIEGRALLCNLPSDGDWGLGLTEDSRRPGIILASHVVQSSPADKAGIHVEIA